MGTNFGEELMGRMAEIDANLRELPDYEKGIQQERERIIKLLDDLVLTYGVDAQMSVLFLTMLIKGENK
jgi:hypothetical protein